MTFRSSVGIVLFALYCSAAAAQTTPTTPGGDLQEVERRLKDHAAEEKRLRQEAAEREREATALRLQLIETANSLQEAEKKITAIETDIAELKTEKTEAQKALHDESENLSEVLAALESLELSKPPALLVTPQDANEAARAAMLLAEAAPAVEARAARLRQAIDRLAELSSQLAADRTAHEQTNKELSARRDVLAELLAKKEKERDVAASLAAAAQRETARLAVKATSLREMMQRLERLAHAVTPRIKPPKSTRTETADAPPPTVKPALPSLYVPTKSFADALGRLRPPVAGRLTGQFGKARPEGGVFEGVRLRARDQAIVTAPFEGRVVVARDWKPIGNLVVLDVGGGYHILLLGVGDILVEENQQIAAGEPIARMAPTDADGGAELDLQIRKNGEPVNPLLWLSKTSREELAQ